MSHGEDLPRLCAVLSEETRACGALSGILREEQAAAIHLGPDAIVASLAGRRLLHERLVELAVARRGLVCSIAREQGENAERGTELLPLLAPEPARRGSAGGPRPPPGGPRGARLRGPHPPLPRAGPAGA